LYGKDYVIVYFMFVEQYQSFYFVTMVFWNQILTVRLENVYLVGNAISSLLELDASQTWN